jgi:hypothetical protein
MKCQHLGLRLAVAGREGGKASPPAPAATAAGSLDQHADHAQRMAAQRKRVLVAGGQLADAEQAGQGLQLVGQRHHQCRLSPRGSASPAKRGL